jgi:hypothetical protein
VSTSYLDNWVIYVEASLKDMLRHGRRFERLRTNEPGVFIRKIPQYKGEPAYLAVEINPIGKDGNPMNKMGAIVRSQEELDAIRIILSQKKVDEIIHDINIVNQHQFGDEE